MTKNNKKKNSHLLENISKQYEKWKFKAVTRSKIISEYKKRIIELIKSRDVWRNKYNKEKQLSTLLKKELLESRMMPYEKVANHSYPLEIILFVIWLRSSSSISLEGVRKVLEVLNQVFDFSYKIPCRETIRNWERKHSFHRLEAIKESVSGEWAIIIDESITIGEEKILLVLGVPLSLYGFDGAVKFMDVRVLKISISKSWKSEEISSVLTDLKSIGYEIKYVVSDACNALKSGIKKSDLTRVADCTHFFGNILKQEYEKLEEYTSFNKACNLLKKQTNLGADAVISPPKNRIKGKFLNLWERAKWSKSTLDLMELPVVQRDKKLTGSMQGKLGFIMDYKPLIERLVTQCETINKLHKVLKGKGLSIEAAGKCREILFNNYAQEMKQIIPNFDLAKDTFWQKIEAYLKDGLILLEQLDLPKIICSSDIIESMFGKYKARVKKGTSSVTDDCLNIANFVGSFSRKETKEAMETIKIIDINNWRKENCKFGLRAKKQKLYKKAG